MHTRIRQMLADIFDQLDDMRIDLWDVIDEYDDLIMYHPQKQFEDERERVMQLIELLSNAIETFEREEGIRQ